MLFAGGQCQNKPIFSVNILGPSNQTAREQPEIFIRAAQHAQGRPAKGTGDTQALAFTGDKIGPKAARAFEQTVSQGFGKPGHENGFPTVGLIDSGLQVFDAAEKIGRLNGHGAVIRDFVQPGQISGTVGKVGQFHDFQSGGFKIGGNHLAIMGMNRTGYHRFVLL